MGVKVTTIKFERHYSKEDIKSLFERFSLPSDFLFGVANAPFQVEGGFNGEGEPLNNWVELERSGKVERSGEAIRFWTDYPEQLVMAQNIGLNGFRLGVDWARVQPGKSIRPESTPPFDRAAIEAYSDMIASIMQAGMEPVLTLHHFVHPYWVGIDFWLDYEKLDLFERYVREITRELNTLLIEKHNLRPIKYYVTINEMNGLAPIMYLLRKFPHKKFGYLNSFKATSNMIAGHCRAYDTVHKIYEENGWEMPFVSYNTINMANYFLDKFYTDLLNARAHGIERNDLWEYIKEGKRKWDEEISKCPEVWDAPWLARKGEQILNIALDRFFSLEKLENGIKEIYSSDYPVKLDYLGVDFYDPFLRNMYRVPSLSDIREKRINLNAEHWEWVLNPRAMYHFLRAETIGGESLPVLILENGMAYKVHEGRVEQRFDQATRDKFLQCFIFEAMRACADGINLKGYFYWTMVDNYEWGSYEPRFGLFTVDRSRSPIKISSVDAWGVNAAKAYREIIEALRSGNSSQIVEAFTKDDW